jgi:adenylate cyclase
MATRTTTPLLIMFVDLSRYAAQSQRVEDLELAETVDELYELVAGAILGAGGRVVKFIGDATLAVFPESAVDAGVSMLLQLKVTVDRFMEDKGWECRLNAKVHFGEVVTGQFGGPGRKRYDVLGREVNVAAMLQAGSGITLSHEAFRRLSPDLRRGFKKHTPAVTYYRRDPRPFIPKGG